MPLYEYLCVDCGQTSEILILNTATQPECQACHSRNLKKLLSAHSSLSGASKNQMPCSAGEMGSCGCQPGQGVPPSCAGPGSCCGNN